MRRAVRATDKVLPVRLFPPNLRLRHSWPSPPLAGVLPPNKLLHPWATIMARLVIFTWNPVQGGLLVLSQPPVRRCVSHLTGFIRSSLFIFLGWLSAGQPEVS